MELGLIVYAAGILLGAVMVWIGLRLLADASRRSAPGAAAAAPRAPDGFAVSGAALSAAGALIILLSIQSIVHRQHEIARAVRPTSFMDLDAPPIPVDDIKPPRPEPPMGH